MVFTTRLKMSIRPNSLCYGLYSESKNPLVGINAKQCIVCLFHHRDCSLGLPHNFNLYANSGFYSSCDTFFEPSDSN